MTKYEAIIKVEYRFKFDSDKTSIKELKIEAEDIFDKMSSLGLESEKYESTEVNVVSY
jgi:hypothetical protein